MVTIFIIAFQILSTYKEFKHIMKSHLNIYTPAIISKNTYNYSACNTNRSATYKKWVEKIKPCYNGASTVHKEKSTLGKIS